MAIQWRSAPIPKEAQAIDLLCFRLGKFTLAIHIAPVIQIIDMVTISPLLRETGFIEGVINLRGTLVPVVDLRRYLNLGSWERGLHTPIILASINQRTLGLIVDEVLGVSSFARDQLAQTFDFLPSALQPDPFWGGLISGRSDVRLLLNLDGLFTSERLVAVAQLVEALKLSGETVGMKPVTESG